MKGRSYKIRGVDIILGVLFFAGCIYFFYKMKVQFQYHWNWSAIPQYILRYDDESRRWVPNVLLQGLLTTFRLSLWSMLLATLIGTLAGLCRVSRGLFNRMIGRAYVELIRNLPPLVLIFIFYFFIGDQVVAFLGVDEWVRQGSEQFQALLAWLFAPAPLFSAFLSALFTLALFEGAYIAEIVRSGIQSIDRGQWEASYALGLSGYQQMRYIILPQAVRTILPPMAGQLISTVKDSAIVSVISIQELTFQGMELTASTYMTFEIWTTVTAMYLLLTLTLSLGVGRLETLLQKKRGGASFGRS